MVVQTSESSHTCTATGTEKSGCPGGRSVPPTDAHTLLSTLILVAVDWTQSMAHILHSMFIATILSWTCDTGRLCTALERSQINVKWRALASVVLCCEVWTIHTKGRCIVHERCVIKAPESRVLDAFCGQLCKGFAHASHSGCSAALCGFVTRRGVVACSSVPRSTCWRAI